MKTLLISTKSQANKVIVSSLFTPINGKTLSVERYDLGKYKPEQSFVGREVEVGDDVYAVWSETRRDSDGPYKALFCASSR